MKLRPQKLGTLLTENVILHIQIPVLYNFIYIVIKNIEIKDFNAKHI